MEKKKPDDLFEDFLKKSLDSFEEKPNDSVWTKIDQSLEAKPINEPLIIPLFRTGKFWMIAAAISLLIFSSILIISNAHLRSQLNDLTKTSTIETSKEKINLPKDASEKALETADKANKLNNSKNNNDSENSNPDQIAIGIKPNKVEKLNRGEKNNPENSIQNLKSTIDLSKNQNNATIIPESKKYVENQSKQPQVIPGEEIFINKNLKNNDQFTSKSKQESSYKSKAEAQLADLKRNGNSKNNVVRSESTVSDLASVESNTKIDPSIEDGEQKRLPQYAVNYLHQKINTIDRNHTMPNIFNKVYMEDLIAKKPNIKNGILSISTGNINESGSIKKEPPYSKNPFINPMQNAKRSNTYQSSDSWQLHAAYAHSLTNNLALKTGLGYKHFNFANTIKDNIVFRDRTQRPGMPVSQHDFDFRIRCAGGSSTVVVPSEQLDPKASISETALVDLVVKTKYQLDYISIPIGVEWRSSPHKKLFVFCGLSLNADILINKSFERPEITLTSTVLKLKPQNQSIQFDQSQSIVWASRFNAGLGYRISPGLTAFVSPEMYLPITGRTNDRAGRERSSISGLQLGMAYSINQL